MTPAEGHRRLGELFDAACGLPPAQVEALLDERCDGVDGRSGFRVARSMGAARSNHAIMTDWRS